MKIISKITNNERYGKSSNGIRSECRYYFEHLGKLDVTYWNMRKKGIKLAHALEVISLTACVAPDEIDCPKKNGDMKGKVSPQCRNIVWKEKQ